MIQKQLSEIIEADLLALINNKVAEGRTNRIRKKQDLPAAAIPIRKNFLPMFLTCEHLPAEIFLFGMSEDSGFPTKLLGIELNDRDQTLLRLENIFDLRPKSTHSLSD